MSNTDQPKTKKVLANGKQIFEHDSINTNIFLIWGKYHSQVFDMVLNVSNEIGIIIKDC